MTLLCHTTGQTITTPSNGPYGYQVSSTWFRAVWAGQTGYVGRVYVSQNEADPLGRLPAC